MKKIIILVSLFFLNLLVSAQSPITKGVYTVSGSIFFSNQSYEGSSVNNNTFSLTPQFGYFFIDNFYTALTLNYLHSSSNGLINNYYGIGPTVRYYIDVEKIKPFFGLSFIYNEHTNKAPAPNNDTRITSTEWKISGGVDFFITNNFAIEGSLNYSFINYNYPFGYYMSKSKLIQLGVGVNYLIF